MGNIARGGRTSGLPRYLEGARYSAQWAGMPYEVYAGRKGENDYTDDINTRSNAINYLSQFCLQPATIGFKRTFGNDYGVAQ